MSQEQSNLGVELVAQPVVEKNGTGPLVTPDGNKKNRLPTRPRVVIVGAGFGGLSAARELGGSEVDVLLLDRNNYHGFWPLLYQVATAGLEPESIAYPVRAIVRKYRNVDFQMVNVSGVDFEEKQVHLSDGSTVDYDYVVLAAGSANNYFGNDSLADNTYGLKNVDDAIKLRNSMLSSFEQAVREKDAEKRAAMMTFVVVGGGPTGVELAGALAELIRHVMRKDYPMLNISEARVVLVEAMDKILLAFPESLQKKAMRQLAKMGVDVKLKTPVASVEEGLVRFKDGSSLPTNMVVWAAGVRGARLADTLGETLGRGARVKVSPQLQVTDKPGVYAIGDMAYLEGYKPGVAYPMVAPVAIQQGKKAARNILAQVRGEPLSQFRYFDKGSMATIGRRFAVLDAFGFRLTGYIAWLGWLFVHLMSLVGFRNRAIVLTNWVYNYFTYDRGARLISGER